MEAARRRYRLQPRTRFVPPGLLRDVMEAADGAANGTDELGASFDASPSPSDALFFLGSVGAASGRGPCWAELKRALGGELQQTYAAWNVSALRALLRRHDFFLNIHKGCERGHAPVTFRASWLLSAGKLLLSERADARDEREYAGLVTFASQPELPAAYRRLRAQPRAGLKRAVLAGFRARFTPRALFERAGIYTDLNLSVAPLAQV